MKKTALIILDGFGLNKENTGIDAIKKANTPIFDKLLNENYSELNASGESVGLSAGQIGNSEVGHMTIGSGRIIKQTKLKIDDLLKSGEFANLINFKEGIENCKKNNSKLHIMTLFGPGGVHAYDKHLYNIIKIIPEDIKVVLHLFGDGRDLSPKSMKEYLKTFEAFLKDFPNISIGTISGRYYAMDRDKNYERTKEAYDQIVFAKNKTKQTPIEYINNSYQQGKTDEFINPVSFEKNHDGLNEKDSVFFLNYRSDRAIQITESLVESEFNYFDVKKLPNIYFVSMTKYYPSYKGKNFINNSKIKDTLGEVIDKNNYKQLHIAETEKYAHVTKFFNGLSNTLYRFENDILIPSHKVKSYDLDPSMSADEIYEKFNENAKNYNFTIVNYANLDMVGHTGDISATIQAVEKIDEIIGKTIDYGHLNGIDLVVTSDHGNAEDMGTEENSKTAHTENKVPFWVIISGKTQKTKKSGGLYDIAPTVLDLMGIKKSNYMTGKSLLER